MTHRALQIDPADAAPIWRQLEEGVRRLVAAGALAPGATLPSVRDLAKELRINPATVAKAYQRLSDAGVVMVRRGEGTFVAQDPPAMEIAERDRQLREGALRYAVIGVTTGTSRERAARELDAAWEELTRERKGERE